VRVAAFRESPRLSDESSLVRRLYPLYRASVSELWLLDGFDQRLPVELEDLGDEA
jgi:hypothetical protein